MTALGSPSVRVDTAELQERALLLADLAGEAGRWASAIGGVPLGPGAGGVLDRVAAVGASVRSVEAECAELGRSLLDASSGYTAAEEQARHRMLVLWPEADVLRRGIAEFDVEESAAGAQSAVRDLLEAGRAGGQAVFSGLSGRPGAAARISAVLAELSRDLLSNPLVLDALRLAISSIGLAAESVLPLSLAIALRLAGTGELDGVSCAAAGLAGAGMLTGLLPRPGERRTVVAEAPPPELDPRHGGPLATAPRSWGDLVARVPASDPDGPQVVVERYGEQWLVAVSGTTEWSTSPEQAFGALANVEVVAGGASSSTLATLDAMRAAGIPPGAPVTIVGHSQGGAVAARVAQQGGYDVRDVITLGSPVRQIDLPPDTVLVALEHADDPVPELGGLGRTAEEEPSSILVRRPSPSVDGSGGLAPAHALERYVATAESLDADASRGVVADPRLAIAGASLFTRFDGPADRRTAYRLTTAPVAPVPTPAPQPTPVPPGSVPVTPGRAPFASAAR